MADAIVRRVRFPGYDVLAMRDTPSWNEATRRAVDARLATPQAARFFTAAEWAVADALCRRILPQDGDADAILLVALLDAKLLTDHGGGFREADMPYMQEAWRNALAALDADARDRHRGRGFAELDADAQDAMLTCMQRGELGGGHWRGMASATFFARRVLVDVPPLYYSLPKAWNEMGFGGPASPRGYVRLDGDRRDPWEAAEASADDPQRALELNRRVV